MFDGLVDYIKTFTDDWIFEPIASIKRKRTHSQVSSNDAEYCPVHPKQPKPDLVLDVHTEEQDHLLKSCMSTNTMATQRSGTNKENFEEDEIQVLGEIPGRKARSMNKVTERRKKAPQPSLVTALDRVDRKLQQALSPEKNRPQPQPKRSLEFSPTNSSANQSGGSKSFAASNEVGVAVFYGAKSSEDTSVEMRFRRSSPVKADDNRKTKDKTRRFFQDADRRSDNRLAQTYFTSAVHKRYNQAASLKKPLNMVDKLFSKFGKKINAIRMGDKMRYKELLEKYQSPIVKKSPAERPSAAISQSILSPLSTFSERRSIQQTSKIEVVDLDAEVVAAPVTPYIVRTKPAIEQPTEVVDISGDSDFALVPVKKKNSLEEQFESLEYFSESWIDDLEKSVISYREESSAKADEYKLQLQISQEEREQFDEEVTKQLKRRMKISTIFIPEVEVLEEEIVLPPVTPEMEFTIEKALTSGHMEFVLVEAYNQPIKRKDINTLVGVRWLNDEVINFYLNMIVERSENSKDHCRVYAFNTFFYPKIMKEGHATVKRWTRKVDVFAQDLILVPVHLGVHWCMAVIDIANKHIRYYDSMGSSNEPALKGLLKYLQAESLDKKKVALDTSEWKLESLKDIPQQLNGSDCGMFACKFAEYESRRVPITFTQEDMPYFRKRMIYEIVTKTLMSP